jgi:hypothetical protein
MRTTLLSIGLAVLVGVGGTALAEDTQHGSDHPPAKASKPAKAGKGKPAGATDEQIADQLKAFCVKWMGFLETRERDNRKGIKWEKQPSGVAGHFVGYSKEYDCTLKERSSNGTPVATIQYKEFLYQKVGGSQGEAEQAEASVVEATEVTEIFRYNKGQWIY